MSRSVVRCAVMVAGLWAGLAVLAPKAFGQESVPSGGPERAAQLLADNLVTQMRRHPETHGQRVAVSPILGNVFLHYVLDLWFHKKWRPRAPEGKAIIIRYADDGVPRRHKEVERT